jgi:hypothetical protein
MTRFGQKIAKQQQEQTIKGTSLCRILLLRLPVLDFDTL